MGAQSSIAGSYRPPVLSTLSGMDDASSVPPQTIMWVPVHTAVCLRRRFGVSSSCAIVGAQRLVAGSYRAPVDSGSRRSSPPHRIIWGPVDTTLGRTRRHSGALASEVDAHVLLDGSYRPP